MSWQDQLNGGSPSWLPERDEPGVRYLALRDLAEADPRELKVARQAAHREGPIAAVLAQMDRSGFLAEVRPGKRPLARAGCAARPGTVAPP